jgi:hypothetical protein
LFLVFLYFSPLSPPGWNTWDTLTDYRSKEKKEKKEKRATAGIKERVGIIEYRRRGYRRKSLSSNSLLVISITGFIIKLKGTERPGLYFYFSSQEEDLISVISAS